MPIPSSPSSVQSSPLPPESAAPSQSDNRTIAAIAAILATGLPIAMAGSYVVSALTAAGVTVAAATAAWRLLSATLTVPSGPLGPASTRIAATEASYRAAYLLNASRRIMISLKTGDLSQAVANERQYFKLHLGATAKRQSVGDQVDQMVALHGDQLGWKAVMDSRTSAECAEADGSNFDVTDPPLIGWPGSVHVHCRCKAVAPYTDAPSLDRSRVLATV